MKGFWKRSRSRSNIPWLVAFLVFVGGSTPVAAQTLYISKLATYANLGKVREKVRAECMPEARLPIVMREEILKRTSIQHVVPTDELSVVKNELAIKVLILGLNIPLGAGWTTEKRTMKVKSVVHRNGVMAAEHIGYAEIQGGGWLFNRGACSIVERLTRDIGVHTAEWLKAKKLFQEVPLTAPGSEEVKQ